MKALPKCVETLQSDTAMPKDIGELIFFKSINLFCQPIFSYISSFVIAPYAPFSQNLSHICDRFWENPYKRGKYHYSISSVLVISLIFVKIFFIMKMDVWNIVLGPGKEIRSGTHPGRLVYVKPGHAPRL